MVVTHHVEEIPPGFTHGMILDEGHGGPGAAGGRDDFGNLTRAYHQPISLTIDEDRASPGAPDGWKPGLVKDR